MRKAMLSITRRSLFEKAAALKYQGYRLVSIVFNTLSEDENEVLYFFDRENLLKVLHFGINSAEHLDSISELFPNAYIEELMLVRKGIRLSRFNEIPTEKVDTHTTLPIGPYSPILSEPIKLDMSLRNETIEQAIPSTGYVKRGIESLLTGKTIKEALPFIERISASESIAHSWIFCRLAERLSDVVIPERAEYIRLIWCELSRIHANISVIYNTVKNLGMRQIYTTTLDIRNQINELFGKLTGNRVIPCINMPGGVSMDLSKEKLIEISIITNEVVESLNKLSNTYFSNFIFRSRLKNNGKISKDNVALNSAVGMLARASGINSDIRNTDRLYEKLGFKSIFYHAGNSYVRNSNSENSFISNNYNGNSYTRLELMLKEIEQSGRLIEEAISTIPKGDVSVDFISPTKPEAKEGFDRLEAPHGELFYYLKLSADGRIDKIHIKDASTSNYATTLSMFKGSKLADISLFYPTLGLNIAGMER